MRNSLTIILFLLFSIAANAQTQYEMNMTALNDFKKADGKLNALYEELLRKNSGDSIFTRNLKQAQLLWIRFRDAQLKVKFYRKPGDVSGSVTPMCMAMYKQELTEARIRELKQWIEGVDEGDACSGSVPLK